MATSGNLISTLALAGEYDNALDLSTVPHRPRLIHSKRLTWGTGLDKFAQEFEDHVAGASPITLNFGNASLLDPHRSTITWATIKGLVIINKADAILRMLGGIIEAFDDAAEVGTGTQIEGYGMLVFTCPGSTSFPNGRSLSSATLQFVSSAVINADVWAWA